MLFTILRSLVVLVLILSDCDLSFSNDEHDTCETETSLRYHGSYDIEVININPSNCDYQITYKVNIPYPSVDVLDFYKYELEILGWVPFVYEGLESSDIKWTTYIDDTEKGSPMIHWLRGKWKKDNKMIIVAIRYKSFGYTNDDQYPNNDVQNILIQIVPFIKVSPGPDRSDQTK